ncbi:MAG: hypothetical protein P8Q97_15565 [Myxococcota bacterium]|jgi:hypothetical protein|nr:hypothetical protein [Myxococcota bacterium]
MSESTMGIQDLTAYAESRGGRLLSLDFEGMRTGHRWACAVGHEFEASPWILIHGGYWCSECFPSAEGGGGWDWDKQSEIDPLVARFYRK